MMLIKSMGDLDKARQKALEKQREIAQTRKVHIRIGLASCSIAAGALDTLHEINKIIEEDNLPGVRAEQIQVSKTGCIGLCALEPIVQVQIADQPSVTYGKVTPVVAHRILENHIGKGLVVQEHALDNN